MAIKAQMLHIYQAYASTLARDKHVGAGVIAILVSIIPVFVTAQPILIMTALPIFAGLEAVMLLELLFRKVFRR